MGTFRGVVGGKEFLDVLIGSFASEAKAIGAAAVAAVAAFIVWSAQGLCGGYP